MPFGEPLLELDGLREFNQNSHIFRSIDEMNNAISLIIQHLSSSGEYTGIGRVQTELLRVRARQNCHS